MKIYSDENSVLYSSVPDSRYVFKLNVSLRDSTNGKMKIVVSSEMGAGIMADSIGERDFKDFLAEVINSSLDKYSRMVINSENESDRKDKLEIIDVASKIEPSTMNEKFSKLEGILPSSIIEILNKGNWEEANRELAVVLCKQNDDLNLWLLNSHIC